jgi:putative oxidoreductase
VSPGGLARWAPVYARVALAAAFLSAVAARLTTWGSGDFAAFERSTAEVNAFLPAAAAPFLARAATVLETALAVGLLVGWRLRWVALGAAGLLALFATAMAVSFGLKSPLDYSVYSASACALLLASVAPASRP